MSTESAQRLLIVEDDADAARNMCDIVELFGYEAVVAHSARETMNREDWSSYSAIILDRVLPDGRAETLLPQLIAAAPGTPVVVVTGQTDLQGAVVCLRAGASDYISKPLEPETLRARLRHFIERRASQEALTRQAREFQTLADNVPALLAYVGPDHSFRYVSRLWQESFGKPQAAFFGKHMRDACGDDVYAALCQQVSQALEGKEHPFEIDLMLPSVGLRSLTGTCVPNVDAKGGIVGVLVLASDITSRKRAEERALQAERLAAIGQMMAGLAHESRNALQRSRACLEMLALEVEQQPAAIDLVARVQKAQEHLEHLYEEVREYAAPIQLRLEPCDLASVWREAWDNMQHLRNGKDVALSEDLAGCDLRCDVDRFAIGQVFRNILENALVVSPRGGKIAVHCQRSQADNQDAVQITFRDQGPGLSPEQRARIFEPFFTTKSKGTGLGMAIAQRIVQAHQGQILALPSEGGAEIAVNLPRSHS